MSYKLVSIDMDGTLLNDEQFISKENIKKILQCIREEIDVVLATGRTFKSAQYYAKILNVNIPIIAYNGALIKQSVGENTIFSSKIQMEHVKRFLKLSEKYNMYTKVYIDDILYVAEESKEARKFSKEHRIEYRVVGKLSNQINSSPYMIVIKESEVRLDYFINRLKSEADLPISITMSTPNSLEIMAYNISKSNSLKILSHKMNVNNNLILTIGNSLNDYHMIKDAGLGIAMKNSDKKLLERWDIVSEHDNNEDGVAHILDKYVLKATATDIDVT
ncbi:Cof-type HAD-IIB family hydrolase [Schnuerera sp. xch1]|uniref:Cof-type HAD-IIB family hydrolase n=1 Tax=Schnuerera sp. xch1 TaxID=2874283 RepID=UPI001CBF5266|nr:Cof-type HAD-IIB family hydrolase [Schnuerera sp. xch1]MBZ2175999.1 Cof-type HAD-IIB family hydrolase [Schnuerera sp. xch1]